MSDGGGSHNYHGGKGYGKGFPDHRRDDRRFDHGRERRRDHHDGRGYWGGKGGGKGGGSDNYHGRGQSGKGSHGKGGNLNNGGCMCHQQRFGIYSADAPHTLRQSEGGSSSLLGTAREFCAAFYHLEDTPEAGIQEFCLHTSCGGRDKCARKDVVCIASLQQRSDQEWRDMYTARYHNCFRGGTEKNLHAEHFLTRDEQLDRQIQELAATEAQAGSESGGSERGGSAQPRLETRLVLYLTYQPCHNSGGHYGAGGHAISCTRMLMEWADRVLKPRGVDLCIRIAYTYRAHWLIGPGGAPEKYRVPVEAAKEGLRLLAAHPGIDLTSCTPADWESLLRLCDEGVQALFRRDGASTASSEPGAAAGTDDARVGDGVHASRAKMDAFVHQTLQAVCVPCGDALEG